MTNYTGPTGALKPPASSPRIIPPRLRRLAAGAWLAAALASTAGAASAAGAASTAGAASASAAAGAAPYAITDIGPAPATGFKVSDIGAVPTPGHHSPDTTDTQADGVELDDINSR